MALLLALLGAPGVFAAVGVEKDDLYPDYAALSAHAREGKDYRIEIVDRTNPVTAIAIHGGRIEAGSDEAAKIVAGQDWNVYAFVAVKPEHNRDLHLTSAHFDEPRALALARRSDRCVSMHGFALEGERKVACVGGGGAKLAKAVFDELKTRAPSIEVEYPCERFGGATAANIVNRCAHPGVQIEMSPALRKKLGTDPELAAQFKAAVRAGMAAK
jgi:phage replication-related protein YjqB (UPF0714/DUF867 family)